MISVVSPFFNEEAVLKNAVEEMLASLNSVGRAYEFIIVNDGSTDGSLRIAQELVSQHGKLLKLVSYASNKGRGHALRKGMEAARGDIIVTTEADGSWGEDIVSRLVGYLDDNPDKNVVIASPHLEGGSYKNVPFKRRLLSSWGNILIRRLVCSEITMFTGMTRAYRRDALESLPLSSDGKEFHLEIFAKLRSMNARIGEIPCCLEWKTHKLSAKGDARKSSTKLFSVAMSHLLFAVGSQPWRYLFGLSALLMIPAMVLFAFALIRFLNGEPAIYLGTGAGLSFISSVLLFNFGVLANQNCVLEAELWLLQKDCKSMRRELAEIRKG